MRCVREISRVKRASTPSHLKWRKEHVNHFPDFKGESNKTQWYKKHLFVLAFSQGYPSRHRDNHGHKHSTQGNTTNHNNTVQQLCVQLLKLCLLFCCSSCVCFPFVLFFSRLLETTEAKGTPKRQDATSTPNQGFNNYARISWNLSCFVVRCVFGCRLIALASSRCFLVLGGSTKHQGTPEQQGNNQHITRKSAQNKHNTTSTTTRVVVELFVFSSFVSFSEFLICVFRRKADNLERTKRETETTRGPETKQ